MKRDNRADVREFLADELADALREFVADRQDVIFTNVPRRRAAIIEYGMDHAVDLAKLLAKRFDCEYRSLLVSKSEQEQKSTHGKEREKNVIFDIKGRNPLPLNGKTVIIVDDIVTTGASMATAGALIRALGAKEIAAVEKNAWAGTSPKAEEYFLRALYEYVQKQYNASLSYYGQAIEGAEKESGVARLFEAFYYMNRGVLRAEMIEFIASIESNVSVLSMDDSGNTRARVKDQVVRQYDYSDAVSDLKKAQEIVPDLPYVYYNLGNLYCLSSEHISSIENYSKAIELYPYMGDAYFNRGLVLIYLKDKEKGCIDLSRAGELGVQDAYSVIKKYCEDEK